MKLDTNTQIEEWKDIKGYEGLYQVSDMGRVKSFSRTVVSKNGLKQYRKDVFGPGQTLLLSNLCDGSKRKILYSSPFCGKKPDKALRESHRKKIIW